MTLYNTEGPAKYHYSEEMDGKTFVQIGYEIENVPVAALCSKNFFFKLFSCCRMSNEKGIQYLYDRLLPSLGPKAAKSRNSRLWGKGQLGGTCSTSCLTAFVRSLIAPEDYNAFLDEARKKMLLHSWDQIKNEMEQFPAIQKVATLEALNTLGRSLKMRAIALPDELQEMKTQLEEMLRAQASREPHVALEGLAATLQQAFSTLKTGVPSESLEKTKQYIDKIQTKAFGRIAFLDLIRFLKTSIQVCSYTADWPLTLEQIEGFRLLLKVVLEQVNKLIWPVSIYCRWLFEPYLQDIEKKYVQLRNCPRIK